MEETKNTNEIIETKEIEETNVIPTNESCEPETESDGNGGFAVVAGVLIAGAALGGGVAFARKKLGHKWEEHQIKKLKKKGYIIQEPEVEEIDSEDVDVVDDSEDQTKK